MSWLWAFISFFNNLWSAIKEWQAARAAQKIADDEVKAQALEKALEDAKKAQTPEDAFKDEEAIVDNSAP